MGNFGNYKIVLASVLKPVDDSRMTEKIAESLTQQPNFEIHVIGQSASHAVCPSITVHSQPTFSRLSFARLFAPWRIFSTIRKINPTVLIITTHELLVVAMLSKLFGCTIIYDVQENYYRNIRYTDTFPKIMRSALAAYVRMKEKICAPFVNHFILAEESYANELTFVKGRKTILENKVKVKHSAVYTQKVIRRLLFSGTLSDTTGVFTAIEIATKLYSQDKSFTLKIVGYAAQKSVLSRIQSSIKLFPFIELIGGDRPVPHSLILEYIRNSDAGIIAYPANPSTIDCTPTKLFEYLGGQLPILLINNAKWVKRCESFNAAVVFAPDRFNPSIVLHELRTKKFYSHIPDNVYWESEERKLIALVDRMVKS